jgi:hypothetical protein
VVAGDYAAGNVQTKTGALSDILGCEKGLENVRLHLFGNPRRGTLAATGGNQGLEGLDQVFRPLVAAMLEDAQRGGCSRAPAG